MRIKLPYILTIILSLAIGCNKADPDFVRPSKDQHGTPEHRHDSPLSNHVLLLYFAGYNTLSSYMDHEPRGKYDIQGDTQDVLEGFLPVNRGSRDDDVLLLYSQYPERDGFYSGEVKSQLVRISRDMAGKIRKDTVAVYGNDVISADSKTLNMVLKDVKRLYPAKDYGFLLSSHGTGWLPAGYTINEFPTESKTGMQKSIGQAQISTSGSMRGYEMDLKNFAAAFPMKCSYILLDACFCGGIEVAYQLKDICDFIAFSPTEIMADGYDYKHIAERLFNRDGHDVVGVCEDSYAHAVSQGNGCTVTAVDCRKLDEFASVCRQVFENNRTGIASVPASTVQEYWRRGYTNWPWFYDLEDIIIKSGTDASDLEAFQNALHNCVISNLATKYFLGLKIETHCGLSMYLPNKGNSTLNAYYTTLEWNKATELVR